jgi:hypothetical protein
MKTYINKKGYKFSGINNIHDEALVDYFTDGIGHRAFILVPSFPFMFIGLIKDVVDDMVLLYVDTTSVPALEKRDWHIHIHNIEVFYIELPMGPKIPNLHD